MMKFADTKPQRISGDAALKLLELECETVCINDTILFDKEICNYRVQRMSLMKHGQRLSAHKEPREDSELVHGQCSTSGAAPGPQSTARSTGERQICGGGLGR